MSRMTAVKTPLASQNAERVKLGCTRNVQGIDLVWAQYDFTVISLNFCITHIFGTVVTSVRSAWDLRDLEFCLNFCAHRLESLANNYAAVREWGNTSWLSRTTVGYSKPFLHWTLYHSYRLVLVQVTCCENFQWAMRITVEWTIEKRVKSA